MNKFYIIGNSGFAKEVLFLALEAGRNINHFEGFIDYDPKEQTVKCLGTSYPVIDEVNFLKRTETVNAIELYIGLGDPAKIALICKKYAKYNFPNLIHPTFVGHKSVSFGRGNIVTAGCVFTVDIEIGSFNVFNLNTTLGHDCIIGDCNVINPGVNISGSVTIGTSNLIGTNATILQGVKIENNSILGAASLATKNVSSNQVFIGVPAKAR